MVSYVNLQELKLQIVNVLKQVLEFFFPITKASTFLDLAEVHALFEKLSKIRVRRLCIYFCYFVCFLVALKAPVLVSIQPLQSKTLGLIGYMLFVSLALAFTEVIILRIWLYLLLRKNGSPEQIQFIQLIRNLDKRIERSVLKWVKLIDVQIMSSSYVFWLLLVIYDGMESLGNKSFFFLIMFYIFYIDVIRYGINDPVILYSMAISGFTIVMKDIQHLKQALMDYDKYSDPLFHIFILSKNIMDEIRKLNTLAKMLLWTHNLLVIPLMSQVIYLALTPANGWILKLFKFAVLSAATLYTLRGYILVAYLSQADTETKKIASLLYSTMVRGKHRTVGQILRLKLILEDLSSPTSSMVVREFHSKVSQIDAFYSVMSTIFTVTLFTTFYKNSRLFEF